MPRHDKRIRSREATTIHVGASRSICVFLPACLRSAAALPSLVWHATEASRKFGPQNLPKKIGLRHGRGLRQCRNGQTHIFSSIMPLALARPSDCCSGYYRRYLPKFVYVKSMLDSGTIGRVTSVNLRLSQGRHKFEGEEVRADWRVDATNAGGGLFMDLG